MLVLDLAESFGRLCHGPENMRKVVIAFFDEQEEPESPHLYFVQEELDPVKKRIISAIDARITDSRCDEVDCLDHDNVVPLRVVYYLTSHGSVVEFSSDSWNTTTSRLTVSSKDRRSFRRR